MKTVFPVFLACVSLPLLASDYNLYCDSGHSGLGDGSIDKPWKALASINWTTVGTQIAAGNNVNINLARGGSWNEQLTVGASGSGSAWIVFQPYGSGALPQINGSGKSYCVTAVNKTNLWIKGLDVTVANGSQLGFQDCYNIQMDGVTNHGGNSAMYLNGTSSFIARACSFTGSTGNQCINIVGAGTTWNFIYCLFAENTGTGFGIISTAGNGGSCVNCTFTGVCVSHISNTSAAAVIGLTNCIFAGTATGSSAGSYPVYNSGSTCIADHCLVMWNGKDISKRLYGVTEIHPIYGDPQFIHTRYPAIITIGEDDYSTWNEWMQLADLMRTNYGWHSYEAYDNTQLIPSNIVAQMVQYTTNGHEIIAHTRWHSTLTDSNAFKLQYVGTGITATATVSGNHLTTTVDGTQDLNVDLTAYTQLLNFVPDLDGLANYTCAQSYLYNGRVPPTILTNVTGVDIKSAPAQFVFDQTNQWYNEIFLSKSDLETAIGAYIPGYTVKAFNYPGGWHDGRVVQQVTNAGYLNSRGVNPAAGSNFMLSSNNLFEANVWTPPNGNVTELVLDGNTLDSCTRAHNFTASAGMTYGSANRYRAGSYGIFNGSSAYVYRSDDADYDFSQGDWFITLHIWPLAFTNTGTLYMQGTDADNYFCFYVDTNAAVCLNLVSNGVSVLNVTTATNALTTGCWQKVTVQELWDRWTIRTNNAVAVMTNNSARLADYSEQVFVGASTNYSGAMQNYLTARMTDVFINNQTYSKTLAVLDNITEQGSRCDFYSHGDINTSRECYRVMLDCIKDFNAAKGLSEGPVYVMTQSEAADYIRTNGVEQADGLTYTRTLTPAANYRLCSGSPLVSSGNVAAVAGTPNLSDMDGTPITDASGTLLQPGLSVGAYQYLAPLSGPVLTAPTWLGNGQFQFSFITATGIQYTVLNSSNLVDWISIQTLDGPGGSVDFIDPNAGASPYGFYRVQLPP